MPNGQKKEGGHDIHVLSGGSGSPHETLQGHLKWHPAAELVE